MKRFIKNILFFTIIFFAFISIIQLAISLHISDKTITGHDNLVQTEHINADLVFLGSSRAAAHFDPAFFDTTYKLKSLNLGVDGHSELPMAILRLEAYLAKNRAPKFAILNFDPLVNAGDEKGNTNFINKNSYARYAFFANKTEQPIVDYFGFNFPEKYIPLYAIAKYQLIVDCLASKEAPYSTTWYARHDDLSNYSPVMDDLLTKYPLPKNPGAVSKSLSTLQALCIKNNIKLICIQTPVYKIAYDEKVFALPQQICSALGIPFIDVSATSIKDLKSNFYNADHLNTAGVLKMNAFLQSGLVLQ